VDDGCCCCCCCCCCRCCWTCDQPHATSKNITTTVQNGVERGTCAKFHLPKGEQADKSGAEPSMFRARRATCLESAKNLLFKKSLLLLHQNRQRSLVRRRILQREIGPCTARVRQTHKTQPHGLAWIYARRGAYMRGDDMKAARNKSCEGTQARWLLGNKTNQPPSARMDAVQGAPRFAPCKNMPLAASS
jgi:hypothetical protein